MSAAFSRNWRLFLGSIIQQNRNVRSIQQIQQRENNLKEEKDADAQPSVYKDTTREYKMSKKCAVEKLQQFFGLRPFAATELATKFSKLQKVTGKTLTNNFELLKDEGVPVDAILQHPDVLAEIYMPERLIPIKTLPFHISETFPLLRLNLHQLIIFSEQQEKECRYIKGGRIQFIANLLQLTPHQACDVLSRRGFLCNMSLEKIETNVKLLKSFGIEISEIQRDYWVLQYRTDVIKERLSMAKSMHLEKMKTWMVRAAQRILERYRERRSDNKEILGPNTLVDYLSEQLECSPEVTRMILAKHPALSRKSMKKIKEIIDFLLAYGFSPVHIVKSPKILTHSVATTQKRLDELKAQGIAVDSLYILTKSQKQYMQYFKALVKAKKRKGSGLVYLFSLNFL